MRTVVFTICARNYMGLAHVLRRSVKRFHPELDFRIYVADGLEDGEEVEGEVLSGPIALRGILSATEYANMALMYNVTEFCTSLKAACFINSFADGFDKCLYMDPDVFVVHPLDEIMDALEDCSILMTPHICQPRLDEGPRSDRGILATGAYNLGFLGLRATADTDQFLGWWHERLRKQAFNDHHQALYTDQRWFDFVPSLFPAAAVKVWRHLGCNVAPWNFHERYISVSGDKFAVTPRPMNVVSGLQEQVPLLFLHFSGFNFRSIIDGHFQQLNLITAEAYEDLVPLYQLYSEAVQIDANAMRAYLERPYYFDRFVDGSPILPSQRRFFRAWRERHGDALDPFGTGVGTFHAALSSRGLGASSKLDIAADKATASNTHHSRLLMTWAYRIFRGMFWVLGRSRFFILIRGLNLFTNFEQHYRTFNWDDADIVRADTALRIDK